jgi:hypothetical protein
MPQRVAAGVQGDGDAIRCKAEGRRRDLIGHLLDDLDLDEVVPGTERADLAALAALGRRADGGRVPAGRHPALFDGSRSASRS